MRANPIKRVAAICLLTVAGAFAVKAAAPPTPQGVITVKEFLDITGTALTDLTGSPKFPDNPDIVAYSPWFEWPTDTSDINTPPPGDVKNNYGVQVQGYFYPTTTGPHVFYIAADDNAVLYLSNDSDPANKKVIAREPQWNPVRDFTGLNRRNADNPENDSSKYTGTEWPTKDPVNGGAIITLTAGTPYYIEAQMKEGGGGDNVAVSLDGVLPINGTQLSAFGKNSGPVSIATQPQSQTVAEGTPVTFRVVSDGTPPFTYQWRTNAVNILDATNETYSIPFTPYSLNGVNFSVVVGGAQGSPVTSANAALTVTQDTTPPAVVSASGGGDFVTVTLTFNERVDITSATFAISGGIAVNTATAVSPTTVVLQTARQTGGLVYTVTINGVKDLASTPNTIAANTAVQFNSAVFRTGLVQFERWNGGTTIQDLINNVLDPAFRPADVKQIRSGFESGRGLGDNYGGRGYAWFKPATSGNYVFIMTVDDNARLFLSTDDNPANKKAIAAEATWSDERQWTSATEEQNSQSYPAFGDFLENVPPWPTAPTITLTAGQTYYLEALWQEGGGGDGVEVTILKEGDPIPANGTAPSINGELGVYVDPSTLPPVITNRPSGTIFNKGDTLTFTVGVESALPVTYQWYRSKIAIPGATSNPLVIPNADHTAVGDYMVAVSNANGSTESYPDNDVRAVMRGAFNIEAEDFNYNGGQTVAAASTQPYLGGAYQDLRSVLNVDFFHDPDNSGGAAFAYNRMDPADEGVLELKGPEGDLERGGFTATVSYAAGWTAAGEWQNYTRTFPQGNYAIIGGFSHDGRAQNEINMIMSLVANPTIPDGSSIGTEGKLQGLTKLGTFLSPGTGGWSNNDLVPLREGDGTGPIAVVALNGAQTLRLTFNSADGDADYFLLYPVTTVAQPRITGSTIAGGQITITWTGGGTLFSSPALVPATWTTTGDSDGSFSEAVGAGNKFYRVQQ